MRPSTAAVVLIVLAATGILHADTTAPVPDNTLTTTAGTARAEALARWHKAKFGLFLHWGAYSVYGGTYNGQQLWSAEWIQENARIPYEEYAKTAAAWNPRDFDADAWVRTAKDAGMGYIVITAKHHDGLAIYLSKASNYNLFASGAYKGPDPLAALKKACGKHGLLFSIYYSPLEFRGSPKGFDEEDEKAAPAGFDYRTLGSKPYATDDQIAAKAKAQIKELAAWYKPDILWFDGTWHMMGKWTDDDARESEQIIRSGASASPITMPALTNRLSDARLLTAPDPKVPVTTGEREWQIGPVAGEPAGPFVVVEVSVAGMPESIK